MKKIRVKLCNLDEKHSYSCGHYILSILKKYYNVEISENPEYVFYNESTYDYLKYDAVRIFYTGENIHPNYNLCDYAISFDYADFGDRHYRFPVYYISNFYRREELAQLASRDFTTPNFKAQQHFSKDDLGRKTDFCSFVYSNYVGDEARKIFFDKLNIYKKVNSGGAYLNNIGYRVGDKLQFESKHKFSIAFENSSRSGYTTEKLPTAIIANTIPIYWGNPDIGKEFNEKRFINCHAYKDFDSVIERIKEIDQNDELYMRIMQEPIKTNYDFNQVREGFELYLRYIIDQPLDTARRIRINKARRNGLELNERNTGAQIKRQRIFIKLISLLYRPLKKIHFFEKLKQHYFAESINKNARASK